jgi:hypothetical protein
VSEPNRSDGRAAAALAALGVDLATVVEGSLRYERDHLGAHIRYEVYRELTDDEAAMVEVLTR